MARAVIEVNTYELTQILADGIVSSISVNVRGHKELDAKYKQLTIRLGQANKNSLSKVAKLLKQDVIKEIRKQVGTRGTRYNPTRSVIVSKPGKAPNDDLGGLVRGIRARVVKGKRGVFNVEFKSTAKYALDLEYGTRNMKARPYMRPALKRNRKKIRAIIAQGVKRAL